MKKNIEKKQSLDAKTKSGNIERKRELDIHCDNPQDEVSRTRAKMHYYSGFDSAAVGSAGATLADLADELINKSRKGPFAKQQRDKQRQEFGKSQYDYYRSFKDSSGNNEFSKKDARYKAAQDVDEEFNWKPGKTWMNKYLKD